MGDSVLLSTEHLSLKDKDRTKKLLSKFIGPFKVKRVVSKVAYELDLPSTMQIHPVFHLSKLKALQPSSASATDRLSLCASASLVPCASFHLAYVFLFSLYLFASFLPYLIFLFVSFFISFFRVRHLLHVCKTPFIFL